MPNWLDDAIEQTIEASLPGWEGKADAIHYFEQKYPRSWRAELSRQLFPFANGQYGGRKVNKPRNLERRFNPDRINKPELENKGQYQALAKALRQLKPPPGGYHFTYDGCVRFSQTCEPRAFEVDIMDDSNSNWASFVAKHPDKVVDVAFKLYMDEQDEDEASAGPCDKEDGFGCKDPNITVTANPDDYAPPPAAKRRRSAVPFFRRRR